MQKTIPDAVAHDIRASLAAQIQQLQKIEAELAHLDFARNLNPHADSDAQHLALALESARETLCTADDLLRVQVPDSQVFSRPPALVSFLMRLCDRRGAVR